MKRALAVVLVSVVGGVACASSSGGAEAQSPAGADAGDAGASFETCTAKAIPASDKVMAVIAANSTCSTAADCTTVDFSTSCFDSCTRAVATSGRAAVEEAKASASANECQAFADAGCTAEHPPCEAPLAPTCVAGKCT